MNQNMSIGRGNRAPTDRATTRVAPTSWLGPIIIRSHTLVSILHASAKGRSSYGRYLPACLSFLFAFFLPTQFGKHFWPVFTYLHGMRIDYLAPFVSAFDTVCFLIVILSLPKDPANYLSGFFTRLRRFRMTQINAVTFLIILAFVINTFFSLSPFITLFRFAKIVLYLGAGYSIYRLIDPDLKSGIQARGYAKYFVYGIFASTLLVFILAVWQFVTKSSVGGLWYFLGERDITLSLPGIAKIAYDGREFLRPYSTFSHPNSMGGFYLVLYFLIEWALNTKQSSSSGLTRGSMSGFSIGSRMTKVRTTLRIAQLLSLFVVILSFSKVAIGVFVFLSLIKLVSDKDYRSCLICFSARISVFLFLLFFVFLFSGDPYTLDKRLFLTTQSFQVIKDHWLTGTGVGASLVAQSRLLESVPGKFTNTLQPVHNIYLLFISEIGLIGIALLSYLIFLKRRFLVHWQKLPLMAISAIALTGMFDHYWLTLPQNIAMLCLVVVIACVTD